MPSEQVQRKRPVSGMIRRRPRGWTGKPRHQFGDAADWMPGGDLGEGIGQIGYRVNPVQFRGLQDQVHCGGTLATGVTTGEEPITSS
jgi:hypothetical protein